MLLNSQRTIYGIDLQMTMMLGNKYVPVPNTTLNEKFHIDADYDIPDDVYPKLNYYTIGVGGVNNIAGTSGYSTSTHSVLDAALFKHVPFVIRPVDEDLTTAEQAQYRFKIKENINNLEYFCYYLKIIPRISYKEGLYKVSTTNGSSKLSLISTDTDVFLNPVPVDRNVNAINYNTSEYAAKVTKLEFSLFNTEIEYLREALAIKYGPDAKLTEIGVCSGIDTKVNNNQRAMCVQVMYHCTVDFETSMAVNMGTELNRAIEIGGMEPIRI